MAKTKRPRKPYKRLQFEDRKEIERLYAEGKPIDEIAWRVGVHLSTIYRELERGGSPYRAETAQRNV